MLLRSKCKRCKTNDACTLCVTKSVGELLIVGEEELEELSPPGDYVRTVYSQDCPKLKAINLGPKVTKLTCRSLPSLEMITCGRGLRELVLVNCPRIKSLPDAPKMVSVQLENSGVVCVEGGRNLQEILVSGCPNLVRISSRRLRKVTLRNCTVLSSLETGKARATISGCPWLPTASGYHKHLELLVYLQQAVRRWILRRKILRALPAVRKAWWHPEAKGGFLRARQTAIEFFHG